MSASSSGSRELKILRKGGKSVSPTEYTVCDSMNGCKKAKIG
jgi:hypothetical protein